MVTIARLSAIVVFGAQVELDFDGLGGSDGSGREGGSWGRCVFVLANV